MVLISWCLSLLREQIPLTKADEYSPFKLQLISFLKKSDPEDKINVSELLFLSCSIIKYYWLVIINNIPVNHPMTILKYTTEDKY